jgi:hypothetical protein
MADQHHSDPALKAREMWSKFSDNERRGVAFGLFPNGPMIEAEQAGFNLRELTLALMQIQRVHDRPKFSLGRIVATPSALDLLAKAQTSARPYLMRHVRGDWGEVDRHDTRANDVAVVQGSRILSAYRVGDERLWIITEADRSSTCILLPSEY